MIESIGPRVFIPTLQETKGGAPFSQIGTARSKAEPPAEVFGATAALEGAAAWGWGCL